MQQQVDWPVDRLITLTLEGVTPLFDWKLFGPHISRNSQCICFTLHDVTCRCSRCWTEIKHFNFELHLSVCVLSQVSAEVKQQKALNWEATVTFYGLLNSEIDWEFLKWSIISLFLPDFWGRWRSVHTDLCAGMIGASSPPSPGRGRDPVGSRLVEPDSALQR